MALLILAGGLSVLAQNDSRIYGRIYTVDNETLEGLIRWDKNEGNWVDILNGTKEMPRENLKEARRSGRKRYSDRGKRIELFGITIGEDRHSIWSGSSSSGIRFGHIKELEVLSDDRALLILKSGQEVEFEDGSTDLGSGIREIVIEDVNEGEIELVWDDIDRIEFLQATTDQPSNSGKRLYGTLTTRRGDEFTGFVCWDIDELFENDILDGDDRRRKRKVKFGLIAAIERYSSSAARLTMKDGEELVLRGSNDVDDDNRGIVIGDPKLGDVRVDWSDFERLDFSDAPEEAPYSYFDGGKELTGTVYTESGDEYEGTIRWDNDEDRSWEILDGSYRDIVFDIEFGNIAEIEKRGHSSCVVTLRDGREFRLRDSNDVDDDNKGIFVKTASDETIIVDWEDFEKVVFN
jgi:hypothetical protein